MDSTLCLTSLNLFDKWINNKLTKYILHFIVNTRPSRKTPIDVFEIWKDYTLLKRKQLLNFFKETTWLGHEIGEVVVKLNKKIGAMIEVELLNSIWEMEFFLVAVQ